MQITKQNIVGGQVRKLRVQAGLSQEAFATQLQLAGWDLSRAGLSKIEAGLRRVNDAEVWVLARTLRVPLEDLYPSRERHLHGVLRHGRG